MTKKESQAVARTRGKFIAQTAADQTAGFAGAYLAGRYNRNAEIMGYNANAVLGGAAALMFRRAKGMGGRSP